MLVKIDHYLRKLSTIILALLSIILASMLVVCWLHVFYRYVLNNSLSWSEEFMRITLVWFCMLSVSVLALRREHVSIVIFKEKMPRPLKIFCTRFTQILSFLACGAVTVFGIRMVIKAGTRVTPALKLPYSVAYAAVPVAFAVISLYELRNVLADFKGESHPILEKPEDDVAR